jgi:effector-binding domain-containing protein
MDHVVEALTVDSQPIAVIRLVARQDQLSKVVPAACGEVWGFLKSAGIKGGRHVAVYFDGVVNLEVGAEIDAPILGSDRVHSSMTPAGPVATTAHFGDYSGLGDAHQAILQWCKHNGRTQAGPNWEIYGHWTDNPAQLRTDVFYLLNP